MKKTVFAVVVCAMFFSGAVAQAGIAPSPFKKYIASHIDMIVERVAPLARSTNPEVSALADQVMTQLRSVDTGHITRELVATQSVTIMERISRVLFNPQPEPPGNQMAVLRTLSRLSLVGFNPQPEPPGHVMTSLAVLDRISAVAFNPQPEPPGNDPLRVSIALLDGLSAVAFNPQPEPPGRTSEILAVFDSVSTIAFAPQPDLDLSGPPIAEMFRLLNLMGAIAVPVPTANY